MTKMRQLSKEIGFWSQLAAMEKVTEETKEKNSNLETVVTDLQQKQQQESKPLGRRRFGELAPSTIKKTPKIHQVDQMIKVFSCILIFLPFLFLDASTHLYKRLCPSVRSSVHPSVRRSVRASRVSPKP